MFNSGGVAKSSGLRKDEVAVRLHVADMKARARAQEEWGKWNTAPLWNEIARREDELRTPLQRVVRKIGGTLLIVTGCALAYAPIVLPVVKFFVGG